jgi:hypothetical protein
VAAAQADPERTNHFIAVKLLRSPCRAGFLFASIACCVMQRRTGKYSQQGMRFYTRFARAQMAVPC